ncbi:MAG: 4-hydroxythreonine-4-phosphate dehydrogenase PdxA [Bacteroidetes bacterium]|nr:4-hydroxythreonine-4-phosphate dehydrogenase PdxA [Bacteroidota bacterium]
MNKPIIGISIGDVNSIAVEVIIKTLSDTRINDFCCPVVYGSPKVLSYWKNVLGAKDFNLNYIKSIDLANPKKSNLVVCWEEEIEIKIGEANQTGGKYAFKSLEMAVKDLKNGKLDALVTAPLNKSMVNNELLPFKGHTEYLSQQANVHDYIMFLVSNDLKVGLVTGHVPLKDVASKLSKELILKKIKLMNDSLKNDFGIIKPKIAILGLNPHAGDAGLLGHEEKDLIEPAIKLAQDEGIVAYGPYPADGFFGAKQFMKFDAVLAMYHDQGLIPFKYFAFEDGVNYTAGLPFIRTSPDHGTAYNIAGKNQADESSMRNALFTAIDLYYSRNNIAEWKSNSLPFSNLRKERFRMDF